MDPLAEDFDNVSPYNYAMNNPILMIDPDGMAADTTIRDGGYLPVVSLIAQVPKREAVSGVWGNLGCFWTGGNYDGYHYDRQGNPTGPSPIMGTPPDLGFGKAISILKLAKNVKSLFAAKKITDGLSKTISLQKQARHIAGKAEKGKSFLNSIDDAKAVLDAVHSGKATYLGTTSQGHLVFRFNGVTGTNVNLGKGITGQSTNVFMIKGTTSPSVVPTNPLWKP